MFWKKSFKVFFFCLEEFLTRNMRGGAGPTHRLHLHSLGRVSKPGSSQWAIWSEKQALVWTHVVLPYTISQYSKSIARMRCLTLSHLYSFFSKCLKLQTLEQIMLPETEIPWKIQELECNYIRRALTGETHIQQYPISEKQLHSDIQGKV